MKSKVIICKKKGDVELIEKELNDPGPDQIQVLVHASVISPGTEKAQILALGEGERSFPFSPGYCVAGEVVKVGKGVTRFQVGDRVAGKGMGHLSLGNGLEKFFVHIPNEVTYEEAAFLTLGTISLQGVRKARIELGERIAVIGLGLIGQLALQLTKMNGAIPVIGVDRVDSRLNMAEDCGATVVIDASLSNWEDTLKEYTDALGPQVVIESTGSPAVIPDAIHVVREFGRVILLGSSRGESMVNFHRDVHSKAISIIGALAPKGNPEHDSRPGYWTWKEDAECFMELLKNQQIKLDPLITERVLHTEFRDVYSKLLDGDMNMMGTIIKWHQNI